MGWRELRFLKWVLVVGVIVGIMLLLLGYLSTTKQNKKLNISKGNISEEKIEIWEEVSIAPIEDNGIVKATILLIFHPANPAIDYGIIKINKIFEYQHDPRAEYDSLSVGDQINISFQWGAQSKIVEDPTGKIILPGVKQGDKIKGVIRGFPKDMGWGSGWVLYEYTVIE